MRCNKKSFLNTLLGFTSYWDYKPFNAIHADSPGVYTSEKIINLSTIDSIHLKCDCIDGSVVNDLRQSILYSLVFDKQSGYKVFLEPGTLHFKKTKRVLYTIILYLDDDDHKEFNNNGGTLTFNLNFFKI